MCKRVFVAVVVLFLVGAGIAQGSINYDPALPAPAPVLNQGWASDSIQLLYPALSADSPYNYNFTTWVIFRITDDFVAPTTGDIYQVSDFGIPILSTAFNTPPVRAAFGPPNPGGDSAWVSASYTHGEVLLAPGPHSLTISGISIPGGLGAGFWTRIDATQGPAVPEPTTIIIWSLLGGLGVAIGYLRRKRAA